MLKGLLMQMLDASVAVLGYGCGCVVVEETAGDA